MVTELRQRPGGAAETVIAAGAVPRPAGRGRRLAGRRSMWALIGLVFVAVVMAAPFLWLLSASLKPRSQVFDHRLIPDPVAWARIDDPVERLRVGLSDLYRFYRDGEDMLTRVYRDRDAMPDGRRRALAQRDEHLRDVLVEPFGGADRQLRAVVGHAASFATWRSLCLEQELTNGEAVEVMVALVVTTTTGAGPSPANGT